MSRADRTRAVFLFAQYSVEITEVIVAAVGGSNSSNHEVQVLTYLFGVGPTSRRGLGELTGLSRSGINKLVGRLEELGLVNSVRSVDDKRQVLCVLSRGGRRRLQDLDDALADYFVTSAALVKELVELLTGQQVTFASPHQERSTALEIAGRMGAAGAMVSGRIDADLGVGGARPRLALAALADWGDARPVQLAELLGVSSGGLTYIVDQLEVEGLVRRSYGGVEHDRRAVVITLTESGKEAASLMADAFAEHAVAIAEALVYTLPSSSTQRGT